MHDRHVSKWEGKTPMQDIYIYKRIKRKKKTNKLSNNLILTINVYIGILLLIFTHMIIISFFSLNNLFDGSFSNPYESHPFPYHHS